MINGACQFIAYWEGFISSARWDVNAFRVGFGSDTEGPDQARVTSTTTTTRERALANLAARVPQFANVAIQQLGHDLWDRLGEPTQIAMIDLCYNYGELPQSVLQAMTQNGTAVANAIRNHGRDNAGINRDRRAAEAGLVILDGGQVT
jgi:GH24 family phage-related lysozyme (muramidase)